MGVEFKSSCPDVTVKDLTGDISIGKTLTDLKKEQEFLGEKLYTQLASTLVAIPCSASEQTDAQKFALSAVVGFAREAQNFRTLINREPYGPKSLKDDILMEQGLAVRRLKGDVVEATKSNTEVVYEYDATAVLASKLGKLYFNNAQEYLNRVIAHQNQDLSQDDKKK